MSPCVIMNKEIQLEIERFYGLIKIGTKNLCISISIHEKILNKCLDNDNEYCSIAKYAKRIKS